MAVAPNSFVKSNGSIPAWRAPTGSTLEAASDLSVVVGSDIVQITAGTTVALPALTAGTDYTIYADNAGSLHATDADSAAPAGERVVGGFHSFANGGISSRSLWDLNWRPSAPSPRAMVHDPKCGIWADIYLMDTQYGVNGYSRNGAQIVDANSAPVIPDAYGGDGSSTYANLNWWVAVDLATAAGKRLPLYQEFASIAYGVVERQAVGTDPGTTQHQAGHRSDIGCEQITGVMWQWGADINGTSATGSATWNDWADGRGDIYTHSIRSPRFGAHWINGSLAGSRASDWSGQPDISNSSIGARGVCDHLNLQADR
ncbi:phage major tropism determinant [Halomonas sp. S2151]|uniref:phage major tropism determinant n=1 Tax=Halomonas sp. S2151 TaxID=579478 RepID=UPI0026BB92E1